MQLLLLLIRKSSYYDLHSLVLNVVTSKIQNSNSFSVCQCSLEFFYSRKPDIVTF